MRHDQIRRIENLISPEDQIEIERARSPMKFARPARIVFNFVKSLQDGGDRECF
jgi:hypothetical protein